ncbi:cytochrome c [Dechloromonas sp.]|uniref:c-type cytochrome n=1 Tax=Dechloromonas sp. TaxID=1917218 RepID=UPI0011F83721|nr:c-type cytochrome [Dechloromonas sp.]MBU3696618.1 cytochrome c4 [Dechloromonas sp.]TEX44504.1 MAG: cytochrome C [Rhodocyclaceae bacterium]
MRSWKIVLGMCLVSGLAQAQAPIERLKATQSDPAALRSAIDAGKKVTFFCANCHGEDGVSKLPEVPNLAGQNPAYLLEQIRKFGSGERKDAFMQGLIKVLKDEERIQAAAYYASMPVPPTKADAALVPKGKELFSKLCVRCHGDKAHGNDAIARLAGQKLPYLQTTITRYRDQTGIRNNQLMAIATSTLKNDDITAIAHYLTQLP